MTFCSFHAMASSVIYYNTHARQSEIFLFYTSKVLKTRLKNRGGNYVSLLCDVFRDLYSIVHAQELMKLVHLYELLYR